MSGRRHYGTLVWVDPAGDYGIIEPADGGMNICVLRTNATFNFKKKNLSVEFSVREDPLGGFEAYDVTRVSVSARGSRGGDENVIEKGSGVPSTRGGGVYTRVIGPDGLSVVSGYCFRCCENGHEASDCVSDVAHGGGGCSPTTNRSGC